MPAPTRPVPAWGDHRRRSRPSLVACLVAGLCAVGAGTLLGGCGDDQTGQPGIPEVDFTPRLIVEVDRGDLSASLGPRGEDDPAVSADPAKVPTGSVVQLRFAGPGEQRVVGYLVPPGEDPPDLDDPDVPTPAPLVDSGIQRDGGSVTVVLATPGRLELRDHADTAGEGPILPIEITERPS
jgi:hypothetical protein